MRDIKSTRERLEKDLQALIQDTKDLLKSTAQNVNEEAAQVRKRVEERLEAMSGTVQDRTREAEDLMKEGLDAADEIIHQYPYQSLGVSFLVGIMLGMFLRRR